jgi:hypothetical protein
MGEYSAFVAFDTSKLHHAVAVAEAGRDGEVRYLGEIDSSASQTAKLVRKLAKRFGSLSFCYEAGPTGYGLQRQIQALGHDCMVVAPSLIPGKPGKRVKTNRLDALSLARQLRAGDLSAVWVPDTHHEAMRDLTRARRTAPGWPARRWNTASNAWRWRRCCRACGRRRSASGGWSRRSAMRCPGGRWRHW